MPTTDEHLKAVQSAVRDERTRLVSALLKVKWKMLDGARAERETAPTASKTYEECAELLSEFLLREVSTDVEGS